MVTDPEGPLKAEGSVTEQWCKSESHDMEGQPLLWVDTCCGNVIAVVKYHRDHRELKW